MKLNNRYPLSFTILLLLSPITTYAAHDPSADIQRLFNKSIMGRITDHYAHSWIIERFNNFGARYVDYSHAPLASENIQQLGRTAQERVGIHFKKQVDIRNIDSIQNYQTSFKHILLNEKYAKLHLSSPFPNNASDVKKTMRAYGILNCILHHESIHVKYNDPAVSLFIGTTGLVSSLFLTPTFIKTMLNPKGRLKIIYPIATTLTITASRSLSRAHRKYYERRADIEGYYATQCHMCVSEKAEEIRVITTTALEGIEHNKKALKNIKFPNSPEQASLHHTLTTGIAGIQRIMAEYSLYLSAEENELIAAQLKKENKICDYHRAAAIEQTQSVQESL